MTGVGNDKEIETVEVSINSNEKNKKEESQKVIEIKEIPSLTTEETAQLAYSQHMKKLSTCDNNKDWFIEYKKLISQYPDFLDCETIYEHFTEEELQNLFGVVEAEVGNKGGFEERCNVASVIFNRINDERFGDTLSNVLVRKQFTTIRNGKYKKVIPTEETILACEYVYSIQDTAQGALYFEGGKSNVHSKYADYIFTDSSGHKFYK